MQECNLFDKIKESFKTTVKVDEVPESFTLTFKGPRTPVAEAKSQTSDWKLVWTELATMWYFDCNACDFRNE